MTRPSPLDVALGSLVAELKVVRDAIGPDARYDDFGRHPEVQRLLERLQSPDLVAQRPDAAQAYLAVLYAAFRFWDAGGRVLAPPREALETALDAPPPNREPVIPNGACYLQLPHHWLWARVTDPGPHEPLDGCFLADDRGRSILVVAVLGLHPGRQGFTQITLHVPSIDVIAAAETARHPRFAPLMEGGQAAGFKSVATASDLLLLVSLALALPGQ